MARNRYPILACVFFAVFTLVFGGFPSPEHERATAATPANVVFVTPNPTLTPDGTTWESGWTSIQVGLDDAFANGKAEVWVKQGDYNESIQLKAGVDLYGGFDGTEEELAARNWIYNPTYINAGAPTQFYHAVFGETGAVIDGFVITGGNANAASGDDSHGGGIFNNGVSPTIANCRIEYNNSNMEGAGIYNNNCSPLIENTIVANNEILDQADIGLSGAGIYNLDSDPSIFNCVVAGNWATYGSGAMANAGVSSPVVYNTVFWNNTPSSIIDESDNPSPPAGPAYEYCLIQGSGGGGSNIDEPPVFQDDDPFYRLTAFSPCIDRGFSGTTSISTPLEDIAGNTVYDYLGAYNLGGGDEGEYRDIGVHEYRADFLSEGEFHVDIGNGTDDPDHGAASGSDAFKTLHYAMQLVNDGSPGAYTLHVAPGTYSVANGEDDSQLHIVADNVSVIGDSQVPPFPVIDGEYASLWSSGFEITGQNAVVQGLEITKFSSAGILVFDASPTIYGNIVHDIGFAAVEVVGQSLASAPQIVNNLIYFEADGAYYPSYSKGVIVSTYGLPGTASPKILHNTIVGCPSCTEGDSSGVYASDLYCTPEIKYNIVADFPGFGVGCDPLVQNMVSDYNNVWNNGQNFGDDCPGGVYDISQDPMFTADGDYKLESGSPCVDYIPDTESDPVDYDLENNPRPASSSKDIGCYERASSTITPGEYYVDILKPDDTGDGLAHDTAWKTLAHALEQINAGSPGAAGNPYTLHVLPGTFSIANGEPDEVHLLTQQHVNVVGDEGAALDGAGGPGNWVVGLKVAADFATVENLHIENFSDSAIAIADCSPMIHRNSLRNNGGRAIEVRADTSDASPNIWNNLIVVSDSDANGIDVVADQASASPLIYHNTIHGAGTIGLGKGIFVDQISTTAAAPEIHYNIVANSGDFGIYNQGGSPDLYFNDVWNQHHTVPSINNYYGASAGTGDISQDPIFVGDYSLQTGSDVSPCIDAIAINHAHPVDYDIDNNSRPQGAGFDMGCREIVAIDPGTYYVDIVNGADTAANGAASGAGAWKTLHYALGLVNAGSPGAYAVNVAQGMYNISNGEADEELAISQNQVTIRGETNAVINGSDSAGWWNGLAVTGQDAVIGNLEIRNFSNCGIKVQDSSPLIEQNVLLDNAGCGVEVDAMASPTNPEIRNNFIDTGVATATGVRIGAMYDCSPMIYHNTILGEQGDGSGDGIYIAASGSGTVSPEIAWNIVANHPGYGVHNYGGNPTGGTNLLWNNLSGDYDGEVMYPVEQDIYADPLLFGGYKLQGSSPCIDAVAIPDTPPPHPADDDIGGNARPHGPAYDIGCYELEYAIPEPDTYYVDIELGTDDASLGLAPGTEAWKTLHFAIAQINKGLEGAYKLVLAVGTYGIEAGEHDGGLTVLQDNVTIEGPAAGSPAVIDGADAVYWHWGIETEADNTVFKDLSFRSFADDDVGFAAMGEAAIAVRSGSGTVIENCEVYENYEGIRLDSDSQGSTIGPDCQIFRNLVCGIVMDGSSGNVVSGNPASIYDNGDQANSAPGAGILIMNGADQNEIVGNSVFWSGDSAYPQGFGIVIDGGGPDNLVHENIIHDHVAMTGEGAGIYVADASPKIQRNRIYDNAQAAISVVAAEAESSPSIENNLVYNSATAPPATPTAPQGPMQWGIYMRAENFDVAPEILHNTIDGMTAAGIAIDVYGTGAASPDIRYNILSNGAWGLKYLSEGTAPPIGDWNNYWNNQEDYYSLSPGANDTYHDPAYGIDYVLGDGSWCVDSIPVSEEDTATEDFIGTSRPQGEGFDTGAYEMPPASQFPLNISVVPPGGGSVGANNETCSADCAILFEAETTALLNASPAEGFRFLRWEDDDGAVLGTDQSLSVTMDSEKWAAAVFEKVYTLTVRVEPEAAGTVSVDGESCGEVCEKTLAENSTVVLAASPASGFRFLRWEDDDGTVLGTNQSLSATMDSEKQATAVFEKVYALTLRIEPSGAGSVSTPTSTCTSKCTSYFAPGSTVSLTATPDEYYRFERWENESGESLGDEQPLVLEIESATTVAAVFSRIHYDLQIGISPASYAGSVSAEGISCPGDCSESLPAGQVVYLRASAAAGYSFGRWRGADLGNSSSASFALTAHAMIEAVFVEAVENAPPVLSPIGPKTATAGQTLAFELLAEDEENDTLSFSANGLPEGATLKGAVFRWTPSQEQTGTHRIEFIVSDGNGTDSETVVVTVLEQVPENTPPVLNPLPSQSGEEGQPLSFFVTGYDPDGDEIAISASGLPDGAAFSPSDGRFAWTPAYDQAGQYSVVFVATDGFDSTKQTVVVLVNNVNRPPAIENSGPHRIDEAQAFSLRLDASDPDGDSLTFSARQLPKGATLNTAYGLFRWTPGYDQAGEYPVVFVATDGVDAAEQTVVVVVSNVNRPPAIEDLGTRQIDEAQTFSLQLDASDPDGDSLTFSARQMPEGATFNTAYGLFRWTPAWGQGGDYEVVFSATDGLLATEAALKLSVTTKLPAAPSPFPFEAASPPHGAASVHTQSLCFSWPAAEFAQWYDLEVTEKSATSAVVAASKIEATQYCPASPENLFRNATAYRWKIRAGNANGSAAYPVFAFFTEPTDQQEENPEIEMTSGALPAMTPRIVSFPLIPSTPDPVELLTPCLGKYGPDWRFFRLDENETMREYPETPDIAPGISFWLVTRTEKTLTVKGREVDPNENFTIEIPPGLFQLGCPFPFEVDWSQVMIRIDGNTFQTDDPQAAPLVGPLWNDRYQKMDKLTPWQGYYVINNAGRTLELVVPPVVSLD